MTGSIKLRDHPGDIVRLECDRCGRLGQYRKEKLVAQFGLNIALPDLRHEIAKCALGDRKRVRSNGSWTRVWVGRFIGGGFILISTAWKVLDDAQQRRTLATTGPYSYVRHSATLTRNMPLKYPDSFPSLAEYLAEHLLEAIAMADKKKLFIMFEKQSRLLHRQINRTHPL